MPHPVPRWGLVNAAPHEHLIHLRRGRVIQARQGGSCFKRPADTVALVDTSVHRLQFTADQVTREKTGAQITGLAVFRIVNPLLAYQMLNLEQPETYHEILREMLLGATRRLVANLTLDECITRRKDALAAELMAEVAPVVSGDGRGEDSADRGWGIALDTIEIQDVRVLSEEVFEQLQAPYREGLTLEALAARAEVERAEATLERERAAASEAARLEMMTLEQSRLMAERSREEKQAVHRAALDRAALAAEMERERTRAAATVEVAELRAQASTITSRALAEATRAERAAMDTISEDRLRELALTKTLPEVAAAFRDSYDKVVITGGDMGFLGQGMSQVLAALDSFGVKLPGAAQP